MFSSFCFKICMTNTICNKIIHLFIYIAIYHIKKPQTATFSRFSFWIWFCKVLSMQRYGTHKKWTFNSWVDKCYCTRKLENSICSIIFRFRILFSFLYGYYKHFKYFSLKTKNKDDCQSKRVAINLMSFIIY